MHAKQLEIRCAKMGRLWLAMSRILDRGRSGSGAAPGIVPEMRWAEQHLIAKLCDVEIRIAGAGTAGVFPVDEWVGRISQKH
jgi:hypothetical protein